MEGILVLRHVTVRIVQTVDLLKAKDVLEREIKTFIDKVKFGKI